MGQKEHSEFRSDLTFMLGNREDINTRVGGWINDAYITLATMVKFGEQRISFPELGTDDIKETTAYDPKLLLPGDCYIVESVWDSTSDVKLDMLTTWREYVDLTGRITTSNADAPTNYIRRGGYLYLNPTPDDTYNMWIYFRKRPARMTVDDDVTAIGEEWDYPILVLAKLQSLLKFGEYEEYKFEKQEWKELMSGIIGAYDLEKLDRNDTVSPPITVLDAKTGY